MYIKVIIAIAKIGFRRKPSRPSGVPGENHQAAADKLYDIMWYRVHLTMITTTTALNLYR
jgi:hypothetical protein